MSPIETGRLLAEMQRLAAAAADSAAPAATGGAEGPSFAELLRQSIDRVNETQAKAAEMAAAFERGDPSAALPDVMVALEKASLSFQAMTEVRNRLVSAYQEIMSMQI